MTDLIELPPSLPVNYVACLTKSSPAWVHAMVSNALLVLDEGDRVTRDSLVLLAFRQDMPLRSMGREIGYDVPWVWESAWRLKHKTCWLCGGSPIQRHHIERRSHAAKDRKDYVENWYACCDTCHDGPLATMPHAQQLAVKWKYDKCGWATPRELLDKWLAVAIDGGPERVTQEEIA